MLQISCRFLLWEVTWQVSPRPWNWQILQSLLSCSSFFLFPGESWEEINGYGSSNKKKNFFSQYLTPPLVGHLAKSSRPHISIGFPEDFRQVSAIIDVDIVPETCIRVQLLKHGSEKPLGFFIRDGTSVRVTPHGLEKVPGIFISRLLPGGLAESTGLLAVSDEVMEVNGIRVDGKTLDQVKYIIFNLTSETKFWAEIPIRMPLVNHGERNQIWLHSTNRWLWLEWGFRNVGMRVFFGCEEFIEGGRGGLGGKFYETSKFIHPIYLIY